MCGIAGLFRTESLNPTDIHVVERMISPQTHRGPDDSGIYSGSHAILGHRRLAILDLSPAGHQPMCNEDGTVWITFNGEIFNHESLRGELEAKGHRFRSHTDTEAIVHLYEEEGPACV